MKGSASPPGGSHSLGLDDIDDEAFFAAIRQVEAATGRSVAPTRPVTFASEDEVFFACVHVFASPRRVQFLADASLVRMIRHEEDWFSSAPSASRFSVPRRTSNA